MNADSFAELYRRYVEHCARAGVEPVSPDHAAELLDELGPLDPTDERIRADDRGAGFMPRDAH